jgi:phosphoribosylformylglycinamidine synthase
VGGIIRDIFTMGARPVCAINSLRFGPITNGSPPHPGPLPSPAGEGEPNRVGTQAGTNSISPAVSVSPLSGEENRGEGEPTSAEGADLKIEDQKSQIANNRRLFAGVVAGIAHYGNCFGIPTIAGEVYFDKSYEGNPLGERVLFGGAATRTDRARRGQRNRQPGLLRRSATGRDGLAGAAFASQDLTDRSADQQRGAVQVGDPFMEKLVMEACLELLATGAVAGIQDMGAAGLTCSTCETAARAGTGIEIELTKVPLRGHHMTPYEIMLSESQERMLIIVHQGREEEVKRIFEKWDLPWAEIGLVTDTGRMVVKHHGNVVADIPASKLANEAPSINATFCEPGYLKAVREFTLARCPDTKDPLTALKTLLGWPTIASKNWVYRQYDHMVRDGSIVCPGSDAAVIRIKSDSVPVVRNAFRCCPDSFTRRNRSQGRVRNASGREIHRTDGRL